LIRWCGAEIRILAYLKNLTLLACFLGLGLGYAASKRKRLGLGATFATVLAIVLLAHPLVAERGPSFRALSDLLNFADLNSWKEGAVDWRFWTSKDALPPLLGLGLLGFLYALLAFAFVPIGQLLGAHFRAVPASERISHYTWNVAASLAGVAAFFALSFLEASPVAWFAIAAASGFFAARERTERSALLALSAATLVLLGLSDRSLPQFTTDVAYREKMPVLSRELVETRWSPYQKIQLVSESYGFDKPAITAHLRPEELAKAPPRLEWTDLSNYVNGHWYSRLGNVDLDLARMRADYAQNASPLGNQMLLRLPYCLATGRRRALLLGAGMGRDAATAIDEGVAGIDCVEIEQRFVRWGRELHPQHPYESERVHVHVDDARRFLRGAEPASYDLVIFCYLDAHGLTSSFTNTNLDSYVYTKESFHDAHRALAPNGVLAVGFWSPRAFIYRRLERLLADEFGAPPLRFTESLFMTGLEPTDVLNARAARSAPLRQNVSPLPSFREPPGTEPIRPTTDDWPFFYVERAEVPTVYKAVLIAIALLSVIGVRVAIGPLRRLDLHFLFLGAAFMLVETWAISRASLVYGATWYVSSAVIASLLVAILAANAIVEKRGAVSFGRAFPLLLAFLLLATLVDPSRLLDLPRAAQLALAAPLYAVPFLFASAIFTTSFAGAERPDEALASNLLGSVLGGALECLAFVLGLRALGFLALGLYVLAWIAGRRRG
ncbi:hypothetical protein HY251_03795, partial [bacterium]|nr:hypothetical protein [bacterium]